jgi:hypothetical protein
MTAISNPILVVLISTSYDGKLEQINLSRREQCAVIGFIKEMKELDGKEIEIINGATNYVKCINATNSAWHDIKGTAENYNKTAEAHL